MGDLDFIPADTKPSEGVEPLAPGEYQFEIVERELAPNKNETGTNLRFKFQQVGTKRTLQTWLCVEHENSETEQIARGTLSKISRCVGFPSIPRKSESFLGKKITLKLGVEPWESKDGKKGIQNVIKGYLEPTTSAPKAVGKKATTAAKKSEPVEPVNGTVPFDDDDIPF